MDVDLVRSLWDPRAGLAQHRELRAAAARRLGRAPAGPGGVAARLGELGALGRVDRAGAPGVRPPRAGAAEPGRGRQHGVRAARPGRGLAAGRRAGRRPGGRVHLEPVPVAGPAGPRRRGRHRSHRPAARRDHARAPTVVAISLVQSSTGEVAALDDVVAAAREVDALVVVDGSQAVGWLPVDASQVDAFACVGYKWLMSPRGSAFLALSERMQERLRPINAGWYAGADVHTSYYGPPLRLATDARRFDVSPAWFSWVGTAPALELLEQIGIEQVRAHDVALADRFRAGLGLPPGGSAIVSTTVDGCRGEARAGRHPGGHPGGCPARLVPPLLDRGRRRRRSERVGRLRGLLTPLNGVSVCSCRDSERSWRPWWRRGLRWVPRRRRVGPAWPAGWSAARSFRS